VQKETADLNDHIYEPLGRRKTQDSK